MRALEFIRDHVTFKLPYDFSYQMKTPLKMAQNVFQVCRVIKMALLVNIGLGYRAQKEGIQLVISSMKGLEWLN